MNKLKTGQSNLPTNSIGGKPTMSRLPTAKMSNFGKKD